MQHAGEDLDRESDGRWVGRFLAEKSVDLPAGSLVVVDSARILQQIDGIREAFGPRVVHVHVKASHEELARRYGKRRRKYREFATYAEAQANPTEGQVDTLENSADVVINSDRCTKDDVLARTAAALRLLPTYLPPIVDILVGG
jgi:adenylosuccinate synthase